MVDDRVPKMVASYNILKQTDAVAIALRNMMLNDTAIVQDRRFLCTTAAGSGAASPVITLDCAESTGV